MCLELGACPRKAESLNVIKFIPELAELSSTYPARLDLNSDRNELNPERRLLPSLN